MNENIPPIKNVNHNLGYNKTYTLEIPSLCPWCQVSFNPVITPRHHYSENNETVWMLQLHCSYCSKDSVSVVVGKSDSLLKQRMLYPEPQGTSFDELLVSLSPRFVELYRSAERAEQRGDLDLAGMGYRAALEVLLKDYAESSTEDSKAKIGKKNLGQAISDYFGDNPLGMIPADEVRLTANDFVHWARPDDFDPVESLSEEKAYLSVFIQVVTTLEMVHHPKKHRYTEQRPPADPKS